MSELNDVVERLRRLRTAIEQQIDPLRKAGEVGGRQDVAVRGETAVDEGWLDAWHRLDREQILECLGVAEVAMGTRGSGFRIEVARTDLPRCERCRRRRADVAVRGGGRDPLCARCEDWRDQEPPAEPAA